MSILDPQLDKTVDDLELYGETMDRVIRHIYEGVIEIAIDHCKQNSDSLTYPVKVEVAVTYYFGMGNQPITGEHGFAVYINDPNDSVESMVNDEDYESTKQVYSDYIRNYYDDCTNRHTKPILSYYSLYAAAAVVSSPHTGISCNIPYRGPRKKLLVSRSKSEYSVFMETHPELIYDLSTLRERNYPNYEYFA